LISVLQLGTIDYTTGLRLQRSLVEMRHAGQISNVLLLLEHTPVITLGRNANRGNILASTDVLQREGVEVFECDRGGDVTYHGPGQLVGYPIFDLRSFPGPDGNLKTIGAVEYIRRIEEALIRTCADFGVATERVPKITGVWTQRCHEPGVTDSVAADPVKAEPQAKIAAIGVHISRGITSHGFALNVNTNLDHFKFIVPCGIASKPVTSLSEEKKAELSMVDVAEAVARNFGRVFHSQILWVETLDALLGRKVGVPMKAPRELRQLHDDEVFWA
jgi:lipoyl(octanoyl) transferase